MKNGELSDERAKKLVLGLHLKGEIIDRKEGTYGTVFIVDQGEGVYPRHVAYKTLRETEKVEEVKLENFVREVKEWFRARGHPLVLTPYYIVFFKGEPLVCMPFCEMDLQTYMEKREKIDAVEALVFVTQILKGLIFAKSRGMETHQDLKPRNILLEDLGKEFVDFPPKDLHPSIRYRIRIADFGNANAWKMLGKPHGSRPYMASEQFKKTGDFSKVDVFAAGVILHELLTGKHPIGEKTSNLWPWKKGIPKKYKHEPTWKKWAISDDKQIEIGEDKISREFEEFIRNMLLPDSEKRISLEQAFEGAMDILLRVDKPTAKQIELLFEYYDTLSGYYEDMQRLSNLLEVAKLPTQLDIIIDQLSEEISTEEKHLDNPKKVVYFCELCYRTAGLLLRRGSEQDRKKVRQLALRIISEASKWKGKIKVSHMYLDLEFRKKRLIGKLPFRDSEIYATLIGYGNGLLEKVTDEEETRKIFDVRKEEKE